MARSADEIEPQLFESNGITMSHLAYTYGTNGIPIPSGEPWRTRLLDVDAIVTDARRARDLGSEFTIVSLHWGEERGSEASAAQVDVAEQLTASGVVDLIVGHHAHVLQRPEQVNGVSVAYGTGNILSNLPVADHWPASTQDAAIFEFTVTIQPTGDVDVERPVVRPTWVDRGNGWLIHDVVAELGRSDLSVDRRDELRRSLGRTRSVLGEHVDCSILHVSRLRMRRPLPRRVWSWESPSGALAFRP